MDGGYLQDVYGTKKGEIMKPNKLIDELQDTWKLASELHSGQKYGGARKGENPDYLRHIGSVTFEILYAIETDKEINSDLAVKCAILHDTLEDTEITYTEIKNKFGEEVADGVLALTKNKKLKNKREMITDSLNRIKQQPKEIWAVKMADRISNLYEPPYYWTNEKKLNYIQEAKLIYNELKSGNKYLAERLQKKIENYQKFII